MGGPTSGSRNSGCHLTWVARRAMRQSVGQIGQLVAVVTVLQGTHVHAVPPAELPQPAALLLGFAVRIQHDAHPQSSCNDDNRDSRFVCFTFKRRRFNVNGSFCFCFFKSRVSAKPSASKPDELLWIRSKQTNFLFSFMQQVMSST